MTSYRYLGSATTDANGIAKYNFTGSGAGEIDVVASLDNPVESGSIVSETYSILDALFYDDALTDAKWNTNYADVNTNREIVSDGTRYCNTVIDSTNTWFDSTKKYQVDFDFSFERDSSSAVSIGFGNNGYNIHNHFSGALTGSGHYKIITDGNTFQFYLDDVVKGTPITITGNNGLFFGIYRTASLTFKNLTIIEI